MPDEVTERSQRLALDVWNVLGCAGFARVDLMLNSATGKLTLLEANTVRGMTDTSLLPQAADAAGIGLTSSSGASSILRCASGSGRKFFEVFPDARPRLTVDGVPPSCWWHQGGRRRPSGADRAPGKPAELADGSTTPASAVWGGALGECVH